MNDDSSSRLVAELRRWLDSAAAGAQLPSSRTLVAEHGVSPVTVQKALRTLAAEGRVETRPGVGTFARTRPLARPADYGWQTEALSLGTPTTPLSPSALQSVPNDVFALHSGYPDRELTPESLVRAAFRRAARANAITERPPTAGLPDLQAWFANEATTSSDAAAGSIAPSDVVVLPGSQSGLTTAFRALVGAGRSLVVESPTYWGAILAARQVGVRTVPVPSGAAGPSPEAVDRALAESGARAFYAQPNFASPTGANWSPQLRRDLLEVMRSRGAFLIEDDAAHDFGIAAPARPLIGGDTAGHVVYLRSLSKSVAPSVRVAAIVARGPARQRILADAEVESIYVSNVLQTVALDVVTQPAWRSHLRRVARELGARRDLLVAALAEHAPSLTLDHVPTGGLNLWARLPDETRLDRYVAACRDRGVTVGNGDEWFPAEPTGPFVRLNYAGPNPGGFGEAARVLGSVLTDGAW
ncbi:PLP-dependent aminotransferase family protein [Flexivirga sp. ID2601S]|uniref:PLP-dependent aminotransferase family protein n=1 Tax=Flexivirga aerilata TaxID=1656889 RepID=A0A849AH66_9MICO|nr:PLP-dependent aminotransferase family protein [Flexivirga aerilata]NNG39729.1 PLP-dependent aminotransferase family protein [Flexivirga aerilata]